MTVGPLGVRLSWLGAALQATPKELRNARPKECVDVLRALLGGEEVSHDGLVTVDRAKIWTRPEIPPLLIGPAVSVQTAGWGGTWADGLATIDQWRSNVLHPPVCWDLDHVEAFDACRRSPGPRTWSGRC